MTLLWFTECFFDSDVDVNFLENLREDELIDTALISHTVVVDNGILRQTKPE